MKSFLLKVANTIIVKLRPWKDISNGLKNL